MPAAAQQGDQIGVGWWTRSPAQSAPDGGFAVASALDGPVTVAAVVLGLGGEITSGTLSAVETEGVAAQTASIVVCPSTAVATVPTEPGGSLDDAPEPDCEAGSVPFERDADSLRWTADVTGLLADAPDRASLVIVPGPSEGPLAPTFDVRFAAPTVELDLVPETTGVDDGSGGGGVAPSTPAGGSGSGLSPASSPAQRAPVVPGPARVPAADSSATPPPAPPAENDGTPAPVEDLDGGDDLVASPSGSPLASASGPGGKDIGKGATYIAISALVGAAVTAGSRLSRRRGLS